MYHHNLEPTSWIRNPSDDNSDDPVQVRDSIPTSNPQPPLAASNRISFPSGVPGSFYAQLPQFPTHNAVTGEQFTMPSIDRQRLHSQPQQPSSTHSLPLGFEAYSAAFAFNPVLPHSAPLPLPIDAYSRTSRSRPSTNEAPSDLCTLRSLQRQRKREFSNSTSSSISSAQHQSHDTLPISTLTGFAGSESQPMLMSYRDMTSAGPANGGFNYSTNAYSSHPTSHPGSLSSSLGDGQQSSQDFWSGSFPSAPHSAASSIASAEPSPPISGSLPAAGNYYDYFRPLVQAASALSTSTSSYGSFPITQHDASVELGLDTLPTPPLAPPSFHPQQPVSDSILPTFLPPYNFATTQPSSEQAYPIASTSAAPTSASLIPPVLHSQPLDFATLYKAQSNAGTGPTPFLGPGPQPQTGQDAEEPTSDAESVTNAETALTDSKLLPILERGMRIRIRHYEELPNPLGVTHPARNKSKKQVSQQVSPRPESTQASAGGGGGGGDETAEDWEGNWRIVKNASGKKIVGFEIKVNCQECKAMNETRVRDAGEQLETKKVARIVLRNLSTKLLGILTELDQKVQEVERQRHGATSSLTGGDQPRRSSRSRSRTSGSTLSSSSSPSGSSAISGVTATPRTSANPEKRQDLLTSDSSLLQETAGLSLWTIPRELGVELSSSACLVCAGLAFPKSEAEVTALSSPGSNETQQTKERGYEDTLSAAIDKFERLNLDTIGAVKEEELERQLAETSHLQTGRTGKNRKGGEDWRRLVHLEEEKVATDHLEHSLKCDVCDLVCGVSRIEFCNPSNRVTARETIDRSTSLSARAFTVETICARCDALFKACSDCGGGGGRLTPGKWRCKELFPDGRRNCQLSHARNPSLNEINIVVSPVSSLSPAELDHASASCRKLFFNTRLGTLCRPEFMLRGDGLASSFQQAENLSIDYWGRLEDVLRGETPPDLSFKRYLTITYSQPRPRHPPKNQNSKVELVKAEEDFDEEYDLAEPRPAPARTRQSKGGMKGGGPEGKTVPWAFSIVEVDFSVGVLFFCCVIPWATSGQSFDANSLLIERTNERVKADLTAINASRRVRGLPAYPRLKYNFIVSPFRLDSKNSQNLNRRGYYTLDQMDELEEEGVNRRLFPPYRQIWLPAHYAKAMHVFVRKLENEADMGGPPPQNAPRKRKKKMTASL